MTANVFRAAADHGVQHVLYSSSIQVVTGGDGCWGGEHAVALRSLPLNGATTPNAGNLYALSKQCGEQLLRHYAESEQVFAGTALRLPRVSAEGWQRQMRDALLRDAQAAGERHGR